MILMSKMKDENIKRLNKIKESRDRKGWHGESRRHSLASRGIYTRFPSKRSVDTPVGKYGSPNKVDLTPMEIDYNRFMEERDDDLSWEDWEKKEHPEYFDKEKLEKQIREEFRSGKYSKQ